MGACNYSQHPCQSVSDHAYMQFMSCCAIVKNNLLRIAFVLAGVGLFFLFAESLTPHEFADSRTEITRLQG